jgi:hypothetical protein
MLSVEERRKFAEVHVEFGRYLIGRQREMVERHKAEGRDPAPAQNLLAVLERTQQVLERDLAQLVQTGPPPSIRGRTTLDQAQQSEDENFFFASDNAL